MGEEGRIDIFLRQKAEISISDKTLERSAGKIVIDSNIFFREGNIPNYNLMEKNICVIYSLPEISRLDSSYPLTELNYSRQISVK